jgi:allantoate deiminase
MTAAETVMERCVALARFSEEPDRLTRRFGTPALRAACDQVAGWMEQAGLAVRRDAVGNLIGRREGEGGTLMLGSHLDTVRDAGRYDGMLGVLVAIACAERAHLDCALEVVAFADEEGVRYGTAYLGSAALAGRFDPAWLERVDADGVRLADLLDGPLPAPRDNLLGYVEVHIEQGPQLESAGVPVGVVTGIVGQSRARVDFVGRAGHAGTVPIDMRADALCGAAEWILAVESHGVVATVGEAHVRPGAANVIPGRARLSLDVRHADDSARAAAVGALRERAQAIAAARGLAVEWESVQETPAVACDPALTEALAAAVAEAGHEVVRLESGAGHDAAMMAAVAPVAMLFVRCAGGVSHHPDESATTEDVAAAIDVLDRCLARWT